jgi:hypothetical protein
MRLALFLFLASALALAGVAYVDGQKYVVEVETPCGPAYVFTAPLDHPVNLGRWLERSGVVVADENLTPARRAREIVGARTPEEAHRTLEVHNKYVAALQSLVRWAEEPVRRALARLNVTVYYISWAVQRLPQERDSSGGVVVVAHLGGMRDTALAELERVAAEHNLSVVVVDVPRVSAASSACREVEVPRLGRPDFAAARWPTLFGRFAGVAYYARAPSQDAVREAAEHLRGAGACGSAVFIVPGDYVPRFEPLEARGRGAALSPALAAVAALAGAAALFLLARRR